MGVCCSGNHATPSSAERVLSDDDEAEKLPSNKTEKELHHSIAITDTSAGLNDAANAGATVIDRNKLSLLQWDNRQHRTSSDANILKTIQKQRSNETRNKTVNHIQLIPPSFGNTPSVSGSEYDPSDSESIDPPHILKTFKRHSTSFVVRFGQSNTTPRLSPKAEPNDSYQSLPSMGDGDRQTSIDRTRKSSLMFHYARQNSSEGTPVSSQPSSSTLLTMGVSSEKSLLNIIKDEAQAMTAGDLSMFVTEDRLSFQQFCYCLEDLSIKWNPANTQTIFQQLDADQCNSLSFYQFIYGLHVVVPGILLYWASLLDQDPDSWEEFLPYPEYNLRGAFKPDDAVDLLRSGLKNNDNNADDLYLTVDDEIFLSNQIVAGLLPLNDKPMVTELITDKVWPVFKELFEEKDDPVPFHAALHLSILFFRHWDKMGDLTLPIMQELNKLLKHESLTVQYAAMHCMCVVVSYTPELSNAMTTFLFQSCVSKEHDSIRMCAVKSLLVLLDRPEISHKPSDDPFWKDVETALSSVLSGEENDIHASDIAEALQQLQKVNKSLGTNLKKRASKRVAEQLSEAEPGVGVANNVSFADIVLIRTITRNSIDEITPQPSPLPGEDESGSGAMKRSSGKKRRSSSDRRSSLNLVKSLAMKKVHYSTNETLSKLQRLIHQYDDDNDGVLETMEIESLLQEMRQPKDVITTTMAEIKTQLDVNREGQVQNNDFIKFYMDKFAGGMGSISRKKPQSNLSRAGTFHAGDQLGTLKTRTAGDDDDAKTDQTGANRPKLTSTNSGKKPPGLAMFGGRKNMPVSMHGMGLLSPRNKEHEANSRRLRAKRRSVLMQRKQIDILLQIFSDDGCIQVEFLDRIWDQLGEKKVGHRSKKDCIETLDPKATGKIKTESLSKWWYKVQKKEIKMQSKLDKILQTINEETIQKTFERVSEGTGKITFAQFCFALEDLRIRWSIDEAKQIFKKLDEKKSKSIDYEEFKQGLFEVNVEQMESFWLRLLGKEGREESLHGKEDLRMDAFAGDTKEEPKAMPLEEILDIIQTKDTDWKKRLVALRDLSTHFCSMDISDDDFAATFETYKVPLGVQITERRSAVCRAACQRLAEIVQYRTDQFLPFVGFFFSELWTIIRVSIKVMSDSGNRCATAMVANVPDNADHTVLNAILTGGDSKFAYVRQCVVQYLSQILEVWDSDNPTQNMEYIDKIEEQIQKSVNDADGKVRTAGFQSLALLSLVDEERSNRVMEAMSAAAKKRFAKVTGKDKSKSGKDSPSGRQRGGSSSKKKKKKKKAAQNKELKIIEEKDGGGDSSAMPTPSPSPQPSSPGDEEAKQDEAAPTDE